MSIELTKKFYVYALLNPLKNNQPFYVGKGTNNGKLRYKQHLSEKKHSHKTHIIQNIISQFLTVGVQILFESDNEDDCYQMEILFIKKYGRVDLQTGCLTNLTDGGEGVRNPVFSTEERTARSLRVQGSNNPTYGTNRPESVKRKISETRKERLQNGQILSTAHSDEWRERLRTDNPGGKATAIPVSQFSINGSLVQTWPSASMAAKHLGYGKGNIKSCATNKKHCTHKGYYWRNSNDPDIIDDRNSNDPDIIDDRLFNITDLNQQRTKPKAAKAIAQYDGNHKLIQIWTSALEIKQDLGYSNSIISNIIRGIRNPWYMGYHWSIC